MQLARFKSIQKVAFNGINRNERIIQPVETQDKDSRR
uniref:Uncharacterized protein n=1 Tax=Tetranychus urticae TaxID=32264 RepID=T1JXP0_TETUR